MPAQALGIDQWVWEFWRPHKASGRALSIPRASRIGAHGLGKDTCWFAPPGMTCTEFYNASHANGTAQPFQHAYIAQAQDKGHDTGADAKVKQYYTPELAEIVYELWQADFEYWGYDKDLFRSVTDASSAGAEE